MNRAWSARTCALFLLLLSSACTNGAVSTKETSQLTIEVVPETAKIYWDDVPLNGNPISTVMPRDGATHRLRVEAAGFKSRTESVALDTAGVKVKMVLPRE